MRSLLSSTILGASFFVASSLGVQAASLTILHNNDGESQLINASDGPEFGGSARFVTLVNMVQADRGATRDVLTLSSGDNFLPGPEFNASLNDGTFYDAQVLNAIGYDAIALGNHDFDFGPDLLADFIAEVDPSVPYVTANLDFSGNANLQALVDAGRIVSSTVVTKNGEEYGIVGATTERLPTISSPGDVVVNSVVPAVQAEIDALLAADVDKIIFISHLQGIDEDIDVLGNLSGVDIAIAGGGDELLTNAADALNPDALTPGADGERFGPYPLTGVTDADGNEVPVVTTQGDYKYLGVLDVEFDDDGNLTSVNATSGIQLVSDAIASDPTIQSTVVDPVSLALAEIAANEIATSEVGLNGVRGDVRTKETNLGNLITDAFIFNAEQVNDEQGGTLLTGNPVVALANGGGIRNDAVIDPGAITELDTFDILPFSNTVSVINNVPVEDLLAVLENAVSNVEGVDGRFAQVSGLEFTYDPTLDPGTRIVDVFLENGVQIVSNGLAISDLLLDLVTVNFLANGGDDYPLTQFDFESIGISYQRALFNFLNDPDGLNGFVPASLYAEGGEGRIGTAPISEPLTAALFGFGLAGLGLHRRKKTK